MDRNLEGRHIHDHYSEYNSLLWLWGPTAPTVRRAQAIEVVIRVDAVAHRDH